MGGPSTPFSPEGDGRQGGREASRGMTQYVLNMIGDRGLNTSQTFKIFYKCVLPFHFRSTDIFLVLEVEE